MLFNTSEKTKNEYVNEILSNDSFTNLKLDLIDLDLKIKAGDHFEVHYSEPVDKKPSLAFNENLLEIKEPKVERKPGKFWKKGIIEINIVTDKDRGELVITVPEDQHLHMLNASSVSGDSSLENLPNYRRILLYTKNDYLKLFDYPTHLPNQSFSYFAVLMLVIRQNLKIEKPINLIFVIQFQINNF